MPGLLSLRRPAANPPPQNDGDVQQTTGGPLRRLLAGRNHRHAQDVDVEMNQTAAGQQPLQQQQQQPAIQDDDAQPLPSHDRQASGRSMLSQISIPSLSALRQRDRDAELQRQIDRAQNRATIPTPNQLENGTAAGASSDPAAAPALADGAPATMTSPFQPPPPAATKRSAKSRREREEAATLFGPNLANYFGSGNSTSGAITAASQAVTAASPVPPPTSPDLASPTGPLPLQARQARLGSRGRARGASLSGLSMMSLGAESVTSLGAYNTQSTDSASAATMDGSTYDLISQVPRPDVGGEIAMSEGIDLDTLKRWVDRSAGTDPGPLQAGPSAATIPPVCTTLQSYVNVKRNAVRLAVKQPEEALAASPAAAATTADLGPLGVSDDHSRSASASTDVNLLRTQPSLSVLPSLSSAATGKGSSGTTAATLLPDPTHTIYFEYDCAAPCASAQIFIRASRKHGSWVNYVAPTNADGQVDASTSDGVAAMLALRGPPPHVLGWPVHVARLKKGFGVGHKAALCLDLKYYAPPSDKLSKKAKSAADGSNGGDGGGQDGDAGTVLGQSQGAAQAETAWGNPIPETPAWDVQRRLEIERDEQEEEAAAERLRRGGRQQQTSAAGGDAATDIAAAAAAAGAGGDGTRPAADDALVETKEQRLAREKAERETLKVAIVVEALDANARPLKEPNLQTTYLRLNSLPVRKPATTADDSTSAADAAAATAKEAEDAKPQRTWSAQVEGQEAEIGPHRFQLQELYGLSSRPPPVRPAAANEEGDDNEDGGGGGGGVGGTTGAYGTSGTFAGVVDDDSNGTECLICLSAPPTTLLLPCTHGLCLECAVQLRESVMGMRQTERRRGRTPRRKYACPVCRRGFTSMLHLSKADEKLVAQSSALPTGGG
ncbi:uncharacterized protein PFL1_00780 [Pseudozyma flocculosa PF-1]|uniref:RING-type domain-containing protein n=1 Tax=Pseudozyma flocculosa TaxID=84751 RepID=A0A5C3F2N4_9BASI|nr:uncharacterized protein PFL1_00780 [Pseudozyma flocculosa PF-1]EPQ31445.1 hypothetical protein PFL1_00780 [Pseudozyma flocculosa PF-1]SPO38773.1 uncharacterized protein PSFLO_04252 [Pseudozyma flocculosa]